MTVHNQRAPPFPIFPGEFSIPLIPSLSSTCCLSSPRVSDSCWCQKSRKWQHLRPPSPPASLKCDFHRFLLCLSRDPRIALKMTRKPQMGSCPLSHQPCPQERIQKKIQATGTRCLSLRVGAQHIPVGRIIALSVRVRFQNQPPLSTAGKQFSALCYTHTFEYYAAPKEKKKKKDNYEDSATKWKNTHGSILSGKKSRMPNSSYTVITAL